ncbi:MAG: helix-turn-helix domain-containing protein [Candidatus Omnitrophica bacterium]|nr:helix-turn-helix domain-containing protein [Candidatus Omnitrophota bacterium]
MMNIGVSVKRLREEQGITLRDLSKDVGVSPSFLSQLEGGKASPSLATLKAIADALQTTVGNLIGDSTAQGGEKLVTTEDERKAFKQSGDGIQMYLLSEPNPYKQMQPLLFKLGHNAVSGENSYVHYGQEFVLILKGALEISLADKTYYLKKGDSIYFNSSTPHSFKNLHKGETEALWVVTPPSF